MKNKWEEVILKAVRNSIKFEEEDHQKIFNNSIKESQIETSYMKMNQFFKAMVKISAKLKSLVPKHKQVENLMNNFIFVSSEFLKEIELLGIQQNLKKFKADSLASKPDKPIDYSSM